MEGASGLRLEARPPRNPAAAGCTGSCSAPSQARSPAPSRSGHASSPCKRRSGREERSGGEPRRGAPILGAPHRRGGGTKGRPPERSLPLRGSRLSPYRRLGRKMSRGFPAARGVGWGGERSPHSHAPAHRPRTSCVSVPGSRLKFPLLLPPAKRARPLARAGPKARSAPLAAWIGPTAYPRTYGVRSCPRPRPLLRRGRATALS